MCFQAEIITAPSRPPPPPPGAEGKPRTSIFLAGSIRPASEPDWRERLTSELAHLPITIYNPRRADWDDSWREDSMSDRKFVEQVHWEMDMQDRADIVVFFLQGGSTAPISMLELGLCVRSGRAVVCVLDNYSKKGYVEAVCRRYGAVFMSSMRELRDEVLARISKEEERR